MALEDAATLAECLKRAETAKDISKVLKVFQEIRGPRCKKVQEWSAVKGKRATVPDGPEQEQRDKNLKTYNAWVKAKPWDGVPINELPELESPNWKAWLNGHDAVGFVSFILSKKPHLLIYCTNRMQANRELDKQFKSLS